tara:strand:- start:1623 stop:1952 length:330 start_codon:yes stop_codon:yes gene_type:complete
MKKVMFIILLNLVIWFGLTSLSNIANANDYNKAVIAHVIKENLDGNGVDSTALMEAELHRIVYAMINEFSGVLQEHLPNILDSIASEIRQKNDKEFKCALLKGSDYECN